MCQVNDYLCLFQIDSISDLDFVVMMKLTLPLLISLGIILKFKTVVAPFPPSHPYSFLNPVIDPWWQKLDKETQKKVYSLWENHEPSLFALGIDKLIPLPAKLYSFSAKTMNLAKRYWIHSGSVFKAFLDYLIAKGVDVKDFVLDDNQTDDVEGRFQSNSDRKWDNFQAMVMYAKHLALRLKKSKVDLVEEIIKKKIGAVKSVAKAKVDLVQEVTKTKIDAFQSAADHVHNSFNSFLTRERK